MGLTEKITLQGHAEIDNYFLTRGGGIAKIIMYKEVMVYQYVGDYMSRGENVRRATWLDNGQYHSKRIGERDLVQRLTEEQAKAIAALEEITWALFD